MDWIFVYGQFRDSGKKLMGPDAKFCGRAWVEGKIYKVDDFYPGYVPGNGKVWGEIYLFDEKNLDSMDSYEGDEYTRVRIKTSTDLECWIYQWNKPIVGFSEIKTGDWQLR
jgi:gamma-glutamylcyclotransferase (GGCT)/AIG2-like uncharacterized protein YtfP